MPITTRKRTDDTRFFIQYEKDSGQIFSVGTSAEGDNFMETDAPVAMEILEGTASQHDYIIDPHERIVHREKMLSEDELILATRGLQQGWEILTCLYIANDNHKHILTKVERSAKDKLPMFMHFNGADASFDFFVIERNRPDNLIDSFKIRVRDLMLMENCTFPVSSDFPDDIDVMVNVRGLFQKACMEIVK